jgi:ethanolamine kinase
LVLSINPHWEGADNRIEFIRFTDGITNTLLKIINRKPGLTEEQIDAEAVLMRAYGNHTEILIDRERETRSHTLLAQYGLAPPLLARFQNGLLYRFIRGQPTKPADLVEPAIWKAVARRLGQWHATLPVVSHTSSQTANSSDGQGAVFRPEKTIPVQKGDDITPIRPRQAGPNTWTVLQKWILALPAGTEDQRLRRQGLQKELERIVAELDDGNGIGEDGLIFAHCDLLCANVIMIPPTTNGATHSHQDVEEVHFIDYEYATPSPAAFDIANHFAEWGGYDCDYNMMPTRSIRREFLTEYVKSFVKHGGKGADSDQQKVVDKLFQDVDRFRGIPGFYWGVWSLIQATISQIDFDYASYAEIRLGEYWAWRHEQDGTRAQNTGEEMPLRERRWAQEA